MARLLLPDGERLDDRVAIRRKLGRSGIALAQWPIPDQPAVRQLLSHPVLAHHEHETVLAAVDDRFEHLRREHGYTRRDLLVLHVGVPGVEEALTRCAQVHYHSDDEARYILAGRGYFGFFDRDDRELLLEVVTGDYVHVPAHAEHWFTLGDSPRLKAVRYFVDPAGWAPVYTGRPVAAPFSRITSIQGTS
ncbi:MAG: cupin domain-containing protein [Burkholderiales bacterium]